MSTGQCSPSLDMALDQADHEAAAAAVRRLTETGNLRERLANPTIAEARRLATILGDDGLGDLLGELDPVDAATILRQLAVIDAADVLELMDPDEAAEIF